MADDPVTDDAEVLGQIISSMKKLDNSGSFESATTGSDLGDRRPIMTAPFFRSSCASASVSRGPA